MKYDAETVAHFITEVNENATKPLTAWETSFMESITDQWDRSTHLSNRQVEILERIYSEKTD